jgi:3-deoxy-manno-octulosonate cytidylyltransferase (CMP-KDO synthetase)
VPTACAIIPARLASTRFPRKALADETGIPMVVHVCRQAEAASSIDRVIVACDDREIIDAVVHHGYEAVLTSVDHPNGSSRVAEVARDLEHDIIVNVQGDEPELDPSDIDAAVEVLARHTDCNVSTLATPFTDAGDLDDPNLVKILHQDEHAVDFSRSAAPGTEPMRHVGLYAFRRPFLEAYVGMASTAREASERLEQLRIIEHGHSIAVAIVPVGRHGIDTPEQYKAFVARWRAKSASG